MVKKPTKNNRFTLADFAALRGRSEAARLLGMSQPSLCIALQREREVIVIDGPDGIFAIEVRPFPAHTQEGKRVNKKVEDVFLREFDGFI